MKKVPPEFGTFSGSCEPFLGNFVGNCAEPKHCDHQAQNQGSFRQSFRQSFSGNKKALAACFRRPPEPNPRSRSAPGQRLSAIRQSKGGTFRQHHDDDGGKDTQNRRFFDSVLFAYASFLAAAMPTHLCAPLRKNPGVLPDSSGICGICLFLSCFKSDMARNGSKPAWEYPNYGMRRSFSNRNPSSLYPKKDLFSTMTRVLLASEIVCRASTSVRFQAAKALR